MRYIFPKRVEFDCIAKPVLLTLVKKKNVVWYALKSKTYSYLSDLWSEYVVYMYFRLLEIQIQIWHDMKTEKSISFGSACTKQSQTVRLVVCLIYIKLNHCF